MTDARRLLERVRGMMTIWCSDSWPDDLLKADLNAFLASPEPALVSRELSDEQAEVIRDKCAVAFGGLGMDWMDSAAERALIRAIAASLPGSPAVPDQGVREETTLEKAIQWLDEKVDEARGIMAFGKTEEGDTGLFLGDEGTSLGRGLTVEEALVEAYGRSLRENTTK